MKISYLSIIVILTASLAFNAPNAISQQVPTVHRIYQIPQITIKIIPANDTLHPLDKYIQLRFFDAINNQTLDHVAFFLNISKNNQTILHDLFETDSGFSSILIEPNETMSIGNWTVYGDHEPILYGWIPKNDTLKISTPLFQNGLYNFQIVMFAMTSDREVFNASTEPKFDSFWNVDQNGNFTSDINSNTLTLTLTDFTNVIEEWNVSLFSDASLLNGMGMHGNHIPSWVKKLAEWVSDGGINQSDFVNAIKYLNENGVIK